MQTPPHLCHLNFFLKVPSSTQEAPFLKKTNAYPIRGAGTKMNQNGTRSGRVQGPIFEQPKWSYERDSHQKGSQKVVLDDIWSDMVQDRFLEPFLMGIPFITPFWLLKNGSLNTTRSDPFLDHFGTSAPNGISVCFFSKHGFLGRWGHFQEKVSGSKVWGGLQPSIARI